MAREWPIPWYLIPITRFGEACLRVGLPLGAQRALTVNGRRTGEPRTVVVWPVMVDGARYILAGSGRSWVRNVEAAETVELSRGRRHEQVRLVPIETDERKPVLEAYWHRSISKRFMRNVFNLAPDASLDDLIAAAPRLPVFRIDPAV
jgi:deazaflavin-dependent oxidoreductase (nitroreductase family)